MCMPNHTDLLFLSQRLFGRRKKKKENTDKIDNSQSD